MKGMAELLVLNREDIVTRWERAVLDDPVVAQAQVLSEPVLRDHVPQLLDDIAAALRHDAEDAGEAQLGRDFGAGALPGEHAAQRFAVGYSLSAVLRELSHLRSVLIDFFATDRGLDTRGQRLVHAALDECMSTAAVQMEAVTNAALRREHDRLVNVLELLPVGVFICDAQGGELASNDAFAAIWGTPRRVPRSAEDYEQFVAHDTRTGQRLKAEDWGLSIALQTGQVVQNQELEILTFAGERRIILNSAAPLLDGPGGEVIGGVAVCLDATELLTALRKLKEESELRDLFLGVLGHDLRHPLNSVKLASTLLLMEDLDEPSVGYVRRAARAADLMERMITALLDFTRARARKMTLERKRGNLWELCAEVVEEFHLSHPRRKLSFTSGGDGEGRWDFDRLRQVFTNLIGNALAYSPEEAEVRVRARATSQALEIEIHNQGPAIPASELEHIFEPFRRGDRRGNKGGLGLGLFIVKEIVSTHGGSISVSSSSQEGTRFCIRLPRDTSASEPPPPRAPAALP